MTATIETKPWDFSHVLDLVNSLSFTADTGNDRLVDTDNDRLGVKAPASRTRAETADTASGRHTAGEEEDHHVNAESKSLGDFGKLWRFLGSPSEAPVVQQPDATNGTDAPAFHISTNYTSDGAIEAAAFSKRTPSGKHKVHHTPTQERSSAEEGTDTLSDGSAVPDTPSLTKAQRKKKNRKERRALEASLAEARAAQASASVSESEAKHVARNTPAKKASVHTVATPPPNKYNLRPRDASGKAVYATAPPATRSRDALASNSTVNAPQPQNLPDAVFDAVQKFEAVKKNQQDACALKTNGAKATEVPALLTTPRRPSRSTFDVPHAVSNQTPAHVKKPNGDATKFTPASVRPSSKANIVQTAPQQQPFPIGYATPTVPKHAKAIVPMTVRSGEDRHWALLIKLIRDFYQDRKYLISPMNLTTHNNDPAGIHVFVDASNIFIGFNDQLKRSRGIPPYVQIPPVDLSFDALALLMERRRPVAKRVLVGSTPHLPAFDKAKAVGYECNILEKVYKARELTERQIFFKEHDRYHQARSKHAKAPPANHVATALNGIASGTGGSSSGGSGSETTAPAAPAAPQFAPARMIEQGVDEILHLKILESVVDTDTPGTIVLATGDAAQAEYSEGFMAMAERALKKGWTVELVSWSKNISQMYTRRGWAGAWGERFKVITLDDYAEELLDM